MKVMIPVVDDNQQKTSIANGFISTDYTCIYDCESKGYEWTTAQEISAKTGNFSVTLKKQGVNCIISRQMPLLALMLFQESGFQVLKAKGDKLEENLELFHKNQLEPFTIQSTMSSSMGCSSSGCSSCDTICS